MADRQVNVATDGPGKAIRAAEVSVVILGGPTVNGTLTAGQAGVTAVACTALPFALRSTDIITPSAGTVNAEQFVVDTAGAALGATSIPVVSQTSVKAHAIGDALGLPVLQQVVVTARGDGGLLDPGPLTGVPLTNPVSATGDTTLYTPAAGKSIRLRWLFLSTPDTNSATVVAKTRWSSTAVGASFYTVPLGKPGVFAHTTQRESPIGDSLVLNLSAAGQPVYVSFDLVEI